MEILFQPVHQLTELLRRKELSSEELVRAALERIRARDGEIHAFNCVLEEEALATARQVDQLRARGEILPPFAGVPIALKDNLCMAGTRTTCSSRMLENFVSPYDATVVAKIKAAMLPILGKTNLDEFAMGSSTENSAFGPTRNPHDVTRIPGGSSGGSAAAVAAGMAPWALGSDTGGSIRQPAALCGVCGMKPTYGRVSRYGLVAFASSLDQIGPFTRDARDMAALLGIIAGHDPRDSTSINQPVPDYARELSGDVSGMKLGIPKEYFVEGNHPEVEAAVRAAIATMEQLGAEVREISLPHTSYATPAYYIICTAEASSNLARYDGVVYSHRTREPVADIVEMFRKSRTEGFGDEVKRRIMLGTYVLSAGFYDAYYLTASRVRTLLCRDFEAAFKEVDLVVCPTSPIPAFKLGEKTADPLEMYLCDVYTTSLNLAGLPGMSIPCGKTREGLPIGVQIIGGVLREGEILRLADAYLG
ncbi:Asp-tRNA(Asn)/Glu-tRNA(Gln) amidotransferase subunit GatA [bacterium]|nr:Asp-tRNA(Asn)/Glu-tRNA(Gln) amidotransferase subunit GatA [bacterium]